MKAFVGNNKIQINPEEGKREQFVRKPSPVTVGEVLANMSFAERRDAAIRKI